jgi:hypothetical protein
MLSPSKADVRRRKTMLREDIDTQYRDLCKLYPLIPRFIAACYFACMSEHTPHFSFNTETIVVSERDCSSATGEMIDVTTTIPPGGALVISSDATTMEEEFSVVFKHRNLSSFIRQCNIYGMRKIVGRVVFYNPNFRRGRPENLVLLKRGNGVRAASPNPSAKYRVVLAATADGDGGGSDGKLGLGLGLGGGQSAPRLKRPRIAKRNGGNGGVCDQDIIISAAAPAAAPEDGGGGVERERCDPSSGWTPRERELDARLRESERAMTELGKSFMAVTSAYRKEAERVRFLESKLAAMTRGSPLAEMDMRYASFGQPFCAGEFDGSELVL